MDHLKQNGIGTGIHYPVPCYLQPTIKNQFSNSMQKVVDIPVVIGKGILNTGGIGGS